MKLQPDDVIREAELHGDGVLCARCLPFKSKGWEAFPSGTGDAALRKLGTLWSPDEPEPTLEEFHPSRTNLWSIDAPIALAWHPYNRCELWQCASCAHPFLRYTEYGGYYEEKRIRELRRELLVDG